MSAKFAQILIKNFKINLIKNKKICKNCEMSKK